MTESNISLLFTVELDNSHFDALLTVEEIMVFLLFTTKVCQQIFIYIGAALRYCTHFSILRVQHKCNSVSKNFKINSY